MFAEVDHGNDLNLEQEICPVLAEENNCFVILALILMSAEVIPCGSKFRMNV